jgi:hypothetical protein
MKEQADGHRERALSEQRRREVRHELLPHVARPDVEARARERAERLHRGAGLGGPAPGTKAEFAVLCHLRFDSVESYQQAIGPVAGEIRNDVANYASEAPIVQLSDVIVAS